MTPATFIHHAQRLQAEHGNTTLLAIPVYQQAVESCAKEHDYDLLYATYQLMWISSHHDHEQAADYGKACMAILKPAIDAGAIMHFSEFGQFQQEVIRYATNCIGWNGFQKTDNITELESLLDLVELGCSYASEPAHYYIHDTQVRILLKLGRTKEAFEIVRTCIKKDKTFGKFNDIIERPDYRASQENNDNGIVADLTDDENLFLQKAERILERCRQQLAADKTKLPAREFLPEKEVITLGEARTRYKLSHYHEDHDSVLLLKGDVVVNGRIGKQWLNEQMKGLTWQNRLYGVIIDGNLHVDGDVVDDEYLELTVLRDVQCDYLFSYDGIIKIYGDANVKYGIYGEYNDGSLDVFGKVNTPYLLSYHHSMPTSAEGEYIYIAGGKGAERDAVSLKYGSESDYYYGDGCHRLFANGVWDEEDNFSVDHFFGYVRKGENPFIKPVASSI